MGYKTYLDLIGMNYRDYTDEETAQRLFALFFDLFRTGAPVDVENCIVYDHARARNFVRLRAFRMDSGDEPIGFRGVFIDMTAQREAERVMKESEERYRTLFTKTSSPIIIIDPRGNFMGCNDAVLLFLECTWDELKTKNISDFLPPDPERRDMLLQERRELWKTAGASEVEYYVQGNTKYLELAVTPTTLKGRDVVFCVGKDMTEYRETEHRLAYMATHDQLTDLPNRVLFNDRLPMELAKARRYKKKLAVMFFDLDHFKDINDALGHNVGDLLLKDLGRRLKDCLRKSDTVRRMGGRIYHTFA